MALNPETERFGAAVGAFVGSVRSVVEVVQTTTSRTIAEVIDSISWAMLIETAIWAFVGATVGFFTTAMWRWIKRKISRKGK